MRITHLLQFSSSQVEFYILSGWNSGNSLGWTYKYCLSKGFDDKARVVSVWRDLYRQHGCASLPVMDPARPRNMDSRQQEHYGMVGCGRLLLDTIERHNARHTARHTA